MFKPQQEQQKQEDIDRSRRDKEKAAIKEASKSVETTKEFIEEEKTFRRGIVSIKDLIAPASMKVTSNLVILGAKYVKTLFVINYPRYISVGWFAPIINLNSTFDVSMFFYPVSSAVILKQLKKKVGALEAQIISDAEKGAARDPLRETALRDIEALRDALTQGIEKFFQYALYVTLYSDTKEDLDKKAGEIENIFGSRLVYSKKVYYQAEQGFNSPLPLRNDAVSITFSMHSPPVASSSAFISSELSADS
ncbi:conjugal transfer protein TraC, partial [bacterium]|nr:conjugal transfer protein TraC [bacterium]